MFRLLTPKRFGGYEADLRTTVEVVSTLGEADGSVAWLVGIGTGASWLLGMVSSDAQDAPGRTVHFAEGSSRMSKSVSSIDKSTLSVSPLLVIEAHSEKKGDRCGWCSKGVGLHRRRFGIVWERWQPTIA